MRKGLMLLAVVMMCGVLIVFLGKKESAQEKNVFEARIGVLDMLDKMNAEIPAFDAAQQKIEAAIGQYGPLASFGEPADLYAFRMISKDGDNARLQFLFKCKKGVEEDSGLFVTAFLDESMKDQLSEKGAKWTDGRLSEVWALGKTDALWSKTTSQWESEKYYLIQAEVDDVKKIPYLITAHFSHWKDGPVGRTYVNLGWHIAL